MTDSLAFALVLTSPPGAGALADPRAAASAIGAHAHGLDERWLAPDEAWWGEFASDAATADVIHHAARAAFAGQPVDVNLVASDRALVRKQLLVADMDSTLIEQECIDEMAAMLGLKDEISAITEQAMRGELDFAAALNARLGLLTGLEETALQRVFDERITLMPGAATLVATMRAHGAFMAIVSGGFSFFTSRVRAALGAGADHSNRLAVADGRLAGGVVGDILGKDAKKAWLEHYSRERGLHTGLTMAVGDGANDLDMIKAAGLGVAYRAKPVVAAEAAASITHGDLTALLYLQGYSRDAFVRQ
jgi:phosphoserine phosphatase